MTYYAVRPHDLPALLADLARQIVNASGEKWYALVDTAFDHEGKALRVTGNEGLALYSQGQLAALSGVSPVLYALPTGNSDQLQHQLSRLLHHCQARPMLSFIGSKLPASDLRVSWQSLLEVETEDQERYLLRFADTRVLPTLASQEKIWKRLAANATAWWSIERDGKLRDLPLPLLPEQNNDPLKIDNYCLAKLLRAGEVDAMADYMGNYFPELLAVRDGYANYEILEQVLTLCSEQSVFGTTDQYALGVAALFTDGRLLNAPEISTWLSEKTWGEKGIEDALAEFMEDKGFS
ncbi:hypothetical protein AT959_08955 [Dechloromonas denitrificans]|uniref:DUF4123 domain-containing protein n=1 Tax=Dechloromonas denitrificans TaxID=281362 RepID=A0A133XIT4_9RHOO|nr:DUF4123 domain-containing protein [Dechloromonas denitrificans]KXB30841.1 hypothetical protein AT959_08955 [Dechloromonas denitrificans]